MDKVVSMINRLSFEQRFKAIGFDAYWEGLKKWKEAADNCKDREFVECTYHIILMTMEVIEILIEEKGKEIKALEDEIIQLKGR